MACSALLSCSSSSRLTGRSSRLSACWAILKILSEGTNLIPQLRHIPLAVILATALAYEPVRSAFTLASQPCDLSGTNLRDALANPRHLVGYALIFLTAAATFPSRSIAPVALAVFGFSALLELQQTVLVTGTCRTKDLLPNAVAVTVAALVWSGARRFQANRS